MTGENGTPSDSQPNCDPSVASLQQSPKIFSKVGSLHPGDSGGGTRRSYKAWTPPPALGALSDAQCLSGLLGAKTGPAPAEARLEEVC